MSLEKIQQALLNSAKTLFEGWTGGALPVCWENTTFTAPEGKPWAAVFFIPADVKISTLGESGADEHNGIFQIDINYPANAGESDMRAAIERVRACFRTRGRITYMGQTVSILSNACSGGRVVDGFYRKSVSVRWRAFTTSTP